MDHAYRVARFQKEVIGINVNFSRGPQLMEGDVLAITKTMLREELGEIFEAIDLEHPEDEPGYSEEEFRQDKIIDVVDGLGDMIVVCLGAMYKMGVNADEVLKEICDSNDTKKQGNGRDGGRGSSVDAVKGKEYRKPDLASLLFRANTEPIPLSPVFVEASKLCAKKTIDYDSGGVNRDDYWVFGFKSIFHEVWKKCLRMKSLLNSGHEPNNESVRDTLIDLINYASFAVEFIDKEAEK